MSGSTSRSFAASQNLSFMVTNINATIKYIDTVRQMIMYCYATLRSKASNKVVKANGGRITVQKLDVDW